jgi:hypothetical protein
MFLRYVSVCFKGCSFPTQHLSNNISIRSVIHVRTTVCINFVHVTLKTVQNKSFAVLSSGLQQVFCLYGKVSKDTFLSCLIPRYKTICNVGLIQNKGLCYHRAGFAKQ